MAFYFVNDGAVDTAAAFQEDLEAIWASGFIAANAEIWTQSGVGSRPNVVAGVELRQPYSQQFVDPIEAQFYPSYLQSWASDGALDWRMDDALAGINGAAAATISFDGLAAAAIAISGLSASDISFSAASVGAVAVSGTFDGLFDLTATATGTVPSLVVLYRGDDAPSWKRQFYDKQLKEFEDSLDEIVQADDPQEAAQEAVEAFQPLETESPIIRESLQAIAEALRGMTMRSLRRKELQAEIADIRAELARVAEYRRKRRNNEAALLLLL